MLQHSEFWDRKYRDKQTGWNAGMATTPLTTFFDGLLNKDIAILIPGCGNAHEARYLLDRGFTNISILDFAPSVVEQLREEFAGSPEVKIVHSDFFHHKGQYDLIIEQTFFCAIEPVLREKYVKKIAELLKPDGMIVGLLFNREFEEGPPYGGHKEEYMRLFEPHLKLDKMEACYNSIAPRAGNELFFMASRKKENE